MGEEKQAFVDKLGPTLTSGLIVALLSASSLGAVALRDLVVTSNVDIAYLKSDLQGLRDDLSQFKAPGSRFTAEDGARLDIRLDRLETVAQQCQEAKVKLQVEIEHLKQEKTTRK